MRRSKRSDAQTRAESRREPLDRQIAVDLGEFVTITCRVDNAKDCGSCRWHHYMRTYKGWRLEGEPGAWRWAGPDPPA